MELLPQALSASFVQLTVQAALISGPYSRVCYLTKQNSALLSDRHSLGHNNQCET